MYLIIKGVEMQKLGYLFSYGDELTPEMARENRNKILVILLLFWFLKVPQVKAVPLPGFTSTSASSINRLLYQ
jgi:hypothetical protein